MFIGEVWYSRPRGLIILAVSCKYFIRNFKSYFTSAKKNETPISVRDKFVLSTTSLRHPKYVRRLAYVIVSKFKFAIRISIIMTDKYYFRKTKPIIDHNKYLSEVGFEPTPSFEDQNSLILWKDKYFTWVWRGHACTWQWIWTQIYLLYQTHISDRDTSCLMPLSLQVTIKRDSRVRKSQKNWVNLD